MVKTTQMRDHNEISTVSGNSKKKKEKRRVGVGVSVGSHVTMYYVKALILSLPFISQASPPRESPVSQPASGPDFCFRLT